MTRQLEKIYTIDFIWKYYSIPNIDRYGELIYLLSMIFKSQAYWMNPLFLFPSWLNKWNEIFALVPIRLTTNDRIDIFPYDKLQTLQGQPVAKPGALWYSLV